jgi:hypothetical protein
VYGLGTPTTTPGQHCSSANGLVYTETLMGNLLKSV